MFLEDAQIHFPYSCDAITRAWSLHGFAHQGARLCVGDTLASPSPLFQIDYHADHAQPESGSRFGNLAHCAFSSAVSGNVRILEEIRQFGTIRRDRERGRLQFGLRPVFEVPSLELFLNGKKTAYAEEHHHVLT